MLSILSSSLIIVLMVGIYIYLKDKAESRKKIPFDIRYERRD